MIRHVLFSGLPDPGTSSFERMCFFCEANRVQVLAALPWPAAEMGGNEGFSVMFEFIRRFGGTRLYVARTLPGFIERLGMEVTKKTHRRFLENADFSGAVDVPSSWGVFVTLRRIAILSALSEGKPRRYVAQCFGVTERYLRKCAQQHE
jgi:hypothetical protein